jgi:hypothetical protein
VDHIQLQKYSSSGTIQWQKRITGVGTSYPSGITVDSLNNLYIVGRDTGSGTTDLSIVKVNSSGSIQWARRLKSTGYDQGIGIAIRGANLYVSGITDIGGNYAILLAKLPTDGSKTGTYLIDGSSIVYESFGMSSIDTTLTDSSGTMTESAASLTSNTTAYADAAGSLTLTRVGI